MSVYETDTFRYKLWMTVMAAMLLLLVAATGYYLMTESYRFKWTIVLSVLDAVMIAALMSARGSQPCMPARASSVIPTAPARPTLRVVQPPVQEEATYVDSARRIKVPLGDVLVVVPYL